MIATFLKLRGTPIVTRSGELIGHLKDLQLDLDNLKIVSLVAKPSGLVKNLMLSELVIGYEQVIQVSDKQIMVEDAVSKDRGRAVLAGDFAKKITPETGTMASTQE